MQSINNFSSTLSVVLATGETTATIAAADAAVINAASPSAFNPVVITLDNDTDIEIVHCTAANPSTGAITITRAQEGTASPSSYAVGALVETRLTAEMFANAGQSFAVREQGREHHLLTKTDAISVNMASDSLIFVLNPSYIYLDAGTLLQLQVDITSLPIPVSGINTYKATVIFDDGALVGESSAIPEGLAASVSVLFDSSYPVSITNITTGDHFSYAAADIAANTVMLRLDIYAHVSASGAHLYADMFTGGSAV